MPTNDLSNALVPPAKRSLADDVVDRLREAIYRGQLAPNQRLREETLAEFLQVSRGPIREALAQLEIEGLIIKQPNRGATVAWLSHEDLDEVYSLRLVLEKLAVHHAIKNPDPKHLDEMQAVVEDMKAAVERGITPQEAALLDVRFHEIIYQAARHKRLYNCWMTLRSQIHIFLLARSAANPDFRDYIIPAHQSLVDALRAKDEERAVTLISEHFEAAYQRILKGYNEKPPAGSSARP